MSSLDSYLKNGSHEASLIELVNVRSSQINGVPIALTYIRIIPGQAAKPNNGLYEFAAWREADFYTGRERAVLAWSEAVTLISEDHVPHDV